MIPEAVRNYVRRTYPDSKIVEAENKTNKFKVELNDGLELTFDRQGNLKKVKDSITKCKNPCPE